MKLPPRIIFSICLFCLCARAFCQTQPAATNSWQLLLEHFDSASSPALAQDGTIYQGTFDGRLFAVTPQGEIKWAFKAGREIKSSPAVADDGTIYFGSRDRKFYAVTPQGKLKWTFATGAWVDSSPAIAMDGTIYFGSWDTNFYALNPDGSKKWIFATGGIIDSSPAIGADGTVYFGSHDKFFYALTPDGKLRWKFPTQGQIVSSPALGADGTIYLTSTDGNLYALKTDGGEFWHLRMEGISDSSPVIDGQGQIYIGISYGRIAVNAAGKRVWGYGSPLFIDASAAVAANGWIYFSAPWRGFEAFDSAGNLQWNLPIGGEFSDSPVIGANGVIYVNVGRMLMAIAVTNNPPLAKSSWPMFRANPQHTGRVR
jgi:outer membrane protein assembly factor BamB